LSSQGARRPADLPLSSRGAQRRGDLRDRAYL